MVVLYLSTQVFLQPHLLDFWTPADLARAWLEYLAELGAMAVAMAAARSRADALALHLGWSPATRYAGVAIALYAAAWAVVWSATVLRGSAGSWPDAQATATAALRYSVVGLYLVAMHDLWRRLRDTDAARVAAEADADVLARERSALQLQLLKAQIEPHFLFNTLANVRRLYRTDAAQGGPMMSSLQRYLRAALPGARRDDARLGDELELVRAYLALIGMRMGPRLAFDVHDGAGAAKLPFPPLVVLTLVENAIKHGLEPSADGGRIDVSTLRTPRGVEIRVADDGVGIGGAQSGGTGVGLRNITAQLQQCYGERARLDLAGGTRGVIATITLDTGPAR